MIILFRYVCAAPHRRRRRRLTYMEINEMRSLVHIILYSIVHNISCDIMRTRGIRNILHP